MSEFALDGLKQVMAIKSRVVLPYLVPKVNPACGQAPLAQEPQPRDHSSACSGDLSVLGSWGRLVVGAGGPRADTVLGTAAIGSPGAWCSGH